MTNEDLPAKPDRSAKDTALDISAFVASAVPWIGGPVSNVLGGISTSRKLARVDGVLRGFAEDLRDFRSEISEEYVRTEDFEELLEETLRRVSTERSEQKRAVYRAFLAKAVRSPGEPYDNQLRVLRSLEQIQPAHLGILLALATEPDANSRDIAGSPIQTLSTRLPEQTRESIEELVSQLNDLRITSLQSLNVMMTPSGAADLRNAITPLGLSLLHHIRGAKSAV